MATEKNPLEAYLTEKQAAGFGTGFLAGLGKGMDPEVLGSRAANAALGIAGTAGVALAALGAQKLYDAATKTRDFKNMLAFNPDLAEKHQEDPRSFNQMFSTLRTLNPAFSRDPIVAGGYLRQMVSEPQHAGYRAVEALNYRDKARDPLGMEVLRGAFSAARGGGSSGRRP